MTIGPHRKQQMQIPFAKVLCNGNELEYVRQALESGWLTTAGRALEFEKRFAEAVGARRACAVNSCTAALHLALEAGGVGPGDKVLVPTLTFTATAEVIRYLGADPVFADVEYGSGLLTPEIVEEALCRHPDIKAVMVVHFGGQAAEMTVHSPRSTVLSPQSSGLRPQSSDLRPQSSDLRPQSSDLRPQPSDLRPPAPGLLAVCRRHNVRVIEDAAHAFPTRLNGRMVGSFGDATCFSFYANKTITTGEGGMLATNDDAIHERAKVMRLHGIDRDIWNRFATQGAGWEYDVVAPGFKYNMPDINAAIGLAQLERAESLRLDRQRCFEYYLGRLADIEGIDLPVIRGSLEDHSCHLFWITLKDHGRRTTGHSPQSTVSSQLSVASSRKDGASPRDRLIERLADAGIGASVHYKPLHRMTYYRDRYGLKAEDFPNAEKHWRGCLSLPVYPGLSEPELAYVCETVHRAVSARKTEDER